MSFKIATIPQFDKDVKRLAKKYHSIKQDIIALAKELVADPTLGDKVFKDCYKVRMAISAKGKGKSGGARVITYVLVQETTIYLLSIYDKSETATIADGDIIKLIKSIDL